MDNKGSYVKIFRKGTWYDPNKRTPAAEGLIGKLFDRDDFTSMMLFLEVCEISKIRKVIKGLSLARCSAFVQTVVADIYGFGVCPTPIESDYRRACIDDFVGSKTTAYVFELNIAFSKKILKRGETTDDFEVLSKHLCITEAKHEVGIPVGIFLALCAEKEPNLGLIEELSGIPKKFVKGAFKRIIGILRKGLMLEKDAAKKRKK